MGLAFGTVLRNSAHATFGIAPGNLVCDPATDRTAAAPQVSILILILKEHMQSIGT